MDTVMNLLFDKSYLAMLFVAILAFATVGISTMVFLAPLTTDFTAWYFRSGLIYALVLAALAFYAFLVSLGGRPLVTGAWLGEE